MSIYEHGYPEMDDEVFTVNEELHEALDVLKDLMWEEAHKSVKESYDQLLKENKELRPLKIELDSIKKEYETKLRELENEKRTLEYEKQNVLNTVRKERMVTLFGDKELVMYKAQGKTVVGDKCDKCDKHRQVAFTSPLGRAMRENCECGERETVYEPVSTVRYKFMIGNDRDQVSVYYRNRDEFGDDMEYDSLILAKTIYEEGMSFGSLNAYSTFFRTEEECSAYCVYLNKNES